MQRDKTSVLDSNTASALAYVLGPISGVVFLVIGKSPRIKFHAMQSIVVFGVLVIVQILLGVTSILATLVPLITVFGFILWLALIYKAWLGDDPVVPMLGVYAKRFLVKSLNK